MTRRDGDQVPWSDQLRRVRAGRPRLAEWMAPEAVVNQVRADYRAAVDWQHDSMLQSLSYQWMEAPQYLSGIYLKRYRAILHHQRRVHPPVTVGVLRADHRIEVRRFSARGDRCLVIDYQTQRRMATYDYEARARLHTQDRGDCAVVYQMVYDSESQRWKIDQYIQQLPPGWGNPAAARHIEIVADLPTASGRDH